MTKVLTAKELAEIVACLLIKPSILGELEDRDRHSEFMLEIGNVVTAFCGGDICGLDDGDDSDEDEYRDPLLIVQPNDSLPSLNQNVWSLFDTESWDLDSDSDTKPYSESDIARIRSEIQSLFAVNLESNNLAGSDQTFHMHAEMLSALKSASNFIHNGVALGFIRMPDPETPDSAHEVPLLINSVIAKAEIQG